MSGITLAQLARRTRRSANQTICRPTVDEHTTRWRASRVPGSRGITRARGCLREIDCIRSDGRSGGLAASHKSSAERAFAFREQRTDRRRRLSETAKNAEPFFHRRVSPPIRACLTSRALVWPDDCVTIYCLYYLWYEQMGRSADAFCRKIESKNEFARHRVYKARTSQIERNRAIRNDSVLGQNSRLAGVSSMSAE